jgi:hypothetical protein
MFVYIVAMELPTLKVFPTRVTIDQGPKLEEVQKCIIILVPKLTTSTCNGPLISMCNTFYQITDYN